MSNKIVKSDSLPSLNPSDKFEKVFLIIPSHEPISNLEDINEETVYGYGTGFFINKSGLFLSVAHNFHDKEKNNYEYVYALLKKQDGNHDLIEIKQTDRKLDKDRDYAVGKIEIKQTDRKLDKDRDYAIGKINVSCDYWNYKLYTEETQGVVHGLKNKRLIGVPDDRFQKHSSAKLDLDEVAMSENGNYLDDTPQKRNIKDIPPCYYENLYDLEYFNLTFYHHSICFNIIDLDKNVGQCKTQHKFKDIWYFTDDEYVEKYKLDIRNQLPTPFAGLSGSPIFDNKNKVIGIHQEGGVEPEYHDEDESEQGMFVKSRQYFNKMIPFDDTLIDFINQNKNF